MAKKLTNNEVVLKALKSRKTGLTDAELVAKTGIEYAATLRSKLAKAGLVVVLGTKKDKVTNRTVKTWTVA